MELNIQYPENKKFSEVCIVRSFTNGVENMIVGTDKGQIKVYGMPSSSYANLAFDSFNAHIGEVVKIMCSPDGRFVFSAGADGTIFVYSVTEYASEGLIYKQEVIVTSAKED